MKPMPQPIPRKSEFHHKSGWWIELDREQIYPDDPGQGTPAMVYSPNGGTGTYYRALDMGEVDAKDGIHTETVPGDVLAWLLKQGYYVEQMYEAGPMEESADARAPAAG